MRELLYTKYRLDYAYFEIINHEYHQVDAFAFSMLENKLLQPESLKLPRDSKINQTEAFYFDTASGMLKIVRWNYSVENDTRGYVESRFQEVPTENFGNFVLNPDLLEILKELLLFTYQACSEKSSVFLKIDSSQLFENVPDQAILCLFLRLYYLFLPSEFAERVIFINHYAETVLNFGKFPVIQKNSIPAMRPDQEKSCLMQILHQTENLLEYRTMLQFVTETFFHYPLQLEEISDSNPDDMQEFEKTVRLWQKVQQAFQRKKLPGWELSSQKKLHHWLIQQIFGLIQQLCDLKYCKTFDALFVHYKKILAILQKEKNAGIYQDLYEKLYLHNFHTSDPAGKKSYLRNSFRVLSDTETDYLSEDRRYYTEICFSSLKFLDTVSEIYALIDHMTAGTISHYFDVLDFNILDSNEVKDLYLRMETSMIQALRAYSDYCQDAVFENLQKELNLVVLFSDSADFDFRRSAFEHYAKKTQNHVQILYFADYFLYRTITLTELLKFFSDWKPEDFYAGFPISVLHALASALQYSRLSQNEKKAFSAFLAQYQTFRKELDHLMIQENPDFQDFCTKHLELMQAHITAYNTCNSQDAKQLLLFLNKTILGSPAILVCMMELYAEKFLSKSDQKKYHYYYQFYELLFLPLFETDQLSLQDLHYFIWMFQKNEFLTSQSKFTKLFQDLEKKFTKNFSSIPVSGKQKNFPGLILHRLSTRYGLSDSEQQALRNQLESRHIQYRNMLCQDVFQNYSRDYVQWLKKYIIAMIKNF